MEEHLFDTLLHLERNYAQVLTELSQSHEQEYQDMQIKYPVFI